MPGAKFHRLFPSETWLLAPTDDMQAYVVTDEQLEQLSAMAHLALQPKMLAPV